MRLLAAAFLLTVSAAAVSAQPTFGLKAGLNVASLGDFEEDSEFIDKMPRLGVVAGAWAQYPFTPSLGVQAEVLYSQKGVRLEQLAFAKGEGGSASLNFNLDYVEVPVLVRFMPDVNPTLDVGLYAGPAFSFKVSESLKQVFDGEEDEYTGDDLFNGTDIGVAVGGDVASGPFGVDLRYTLGVSNVNSDSFADKQGGGVSLDDLKNSAFSATFVYRFGQ